MFRSFESHPSPAVDRSRSPHARTRSRAGPASSRRASLATSSRWRHRRAPPTPVDQSSDAARRDHDQRARLRARPRDVAVRRRGRRARGPGLAADRRSSTTPAPTWGRARGRITVLLTADTTDDLSSRPRRPDRHRRRVRRDLRAARQRREPLAARGRRRQRPGRRLRRDRWRRWRTLDGDGAFTAGGEPVTLVTPTASAAYRGRLRGAAAGAPRPDTVNRAAMESYLRGVVPLEIPALWSPAAVRAQAVAARTYAAYERATRARRRTTSATPPSCQVYGGVAAEHPASNDAIDATRRRDPDATTASRRSPSSAPAAAAGPSGLGALPAAQAGPLRRLVGQPGPRLVAHGREDRFEQPGPVGNLRPIVVLARDGNGDWGGRVGGRAARHPVRQATPSPSPATRCARPRPALDLVDLRPDPADFRIVP